MTLAEELMGIRPEVKPLPGRIVSCDDKPEKLIYVTPTMAAFDEWISDRKGPFTVVDVANELGITTKQAGTQLRRYRRRGQLTLRGRRANGCNPLQVWSYTPPFPGL